MAKELSKVYEPQEVESRIYRMWEQGGYFHTRRLPAAGRGASPSPL